MSDKCLRGKIVFICVAVFATGLLMCSSATASRIGILLRQIDAGSQSQNGLNNVGRKLVEHPPTYWEISSEEYAKLVVNISEELSESGIGSQFVLETALQRIRQDEGEQSMALVPILDELVRKYAQDGNMVGAATIADKALEIVTRAVGQNHPSLVGRLRSQAALVKQAQYDTAVSSDLIAKANKLEAVAKEQSDRLTTMGGGSEESPEANAELVRVFYGTNRKPRSGDQPAENYFESKRDQDKTELHLGEIIVSVPRKREMPALRDGRYWVGEIWNGEYRRSTLVKVTPSGSYSVFRDRLRSQLSSSTRRELLVYVHGYATDWKTAVQRIAAMSVALEIDGAPLLFTWPSRGSFLNYIADGNEVTSTAINQLTDLLSHAIKDSGAEKVYVVAHSMGARFLIKALKQLSTRSRENALISSVVFASPDVDAHEFQEEVAMVTKLSKKTSLYVSSNDRALNISRLGFLNDQLRAGDLRANVHVRGVDTIDTSKSQTDLWLIDSMLGHNDFVMGAIDDLRALTWHGLHPASRCILSPKKYSNGVTWSLGGGACSSDVFKMGTVAARRLGASDAVKFLETMMKEECRKQSMSSDCKAWQDSRDVAQMVLKTLGVKP